MIEAGRDAFLNALQTVQGASAHTIKAYAEDLNQFIDFASTEGVTDIQAVDPALLRSFLAHLQTQNLARASRARKTAFPALFFCLPRQARPSAPLSGHRPAKCQNGAAFAQILTFR